MKKGSIIELSHRMISGKEHFKLETRTFDVTELLPEVKHRPDVWYVLSDITMSSLKIALMNSRNQSNECAVCEQASHTVKTWKRQSYQVMNGL